MIRVCKLDGQIFVNEDDRCFALYDTVVDRFVEISDCSIWESASALNECIDQEIGYIRRQGLPDRDDLINAWERKRERYVGLAKGNRY